MDSRLLADRMTTPSDTPFELKAELARLPRLPGVYRMYDAAGKLLYVGKAKVLRNRVRSYFQKGANHTPKTRLLVAHIARFDTIVTRTEVEALILEDTLIKQHKPPYNIALRDDKRYPWLAISDEPYPRLYVTRRRRQEGKKTRYFGPYTEAGKLYDLLKTLRKYFPMRQRRRPLFTNRPCMNYYLKLCPGPCQGLISKADYDDTVRQVELLLKGQTEELHRQLTAQMQAASEALNFEHAAQLRNRLQAVERFGQRQRVVSEDPYASRDAIALVDDGWIASVVVLSVREGRLVGSHPFQIPMANQVTVHEVMRAFLRHYYREVDDADLPREILLAHNVDEDEDVMKAWLTSRRPGRSGVTLLVPQRGERKELLDLAQDNAKEALEAAKLYEATRQKNDPVRALLDLQEILNLPDYPERMECYDISHFQGAQTVASMVVFTDGVADNAEYRRFKIESAEGKPDDFKSMHEVITRRLGHRDDWPEPDLLIIDGGKGQLSSAVQALRDAGVTELPIISLAKRYEEVYLPGQSLPVLIPHDSPALFLLQQIRDEAHRYAITYHRRLRDKKAFETPLHGIPGVGVKTRSKLLTHYKTARAVAAAPVQEVARISQLPLEKAQQLQATLLLRLEPQNDCN